MLNHYHRTAWRNLCRHRGYSLISICGFSLGLSVCLLLILWIRDEWSYDRFHRRADRIYRVYSEDQWQGKTDRCIWTPAPLAPALAAEFPEIEAITRFGHFTGYISYENLIFSEEIAFADPAFWQMFDFELVRGDPGSVLRPGSVLISRKMQEKYFRGKNPVGQTILIEQTKALTVTGVFLLPGNSSLQFDFLGSTADLLPRSHLHQWGISNYQTYIAGGKAFSPEEFQAKMAVFVAKFKGQEALDRFHFTFRLQPLTNIHLYSDLRDESSSNGTMGIIRIFTAITLLILLVAIFNHVNLSTAIFLKRFKEMALRQAAGATRLQLAVQITGESLLYSGLAVPAAWMLVHLLLPLFNSLTGKMLSLTTGGQIPVFLYFAAVALSAGLLSGLFPALYLASRVSFSTITRPAGTAAPVFRIRRILTAGQLVVSIALAVVTFGISGQLHFMLGKDLGYHQENLLAIPLQHQDAKRALPVIKAEFARLAGVAGVTATGFLPGRTWYQNYSYEGMPPADNPMIRWLPVDQDFIKTLGIELRQGRDFTASASGSLMEVILNERAVEELGWKSPLGRRIDIGQPGIVTGVTRDFHVLSLHHAVEPVALLVYPGGFDYLMVKLRPGDTAGTIHALQRIWGENVPGQLFRYTFADEEYAQLYRTEGKTGTIMMVATILAILISTFGLLGLAMLATRQRIREIAIRKVLGAAVPEIVRMLTGELSRQVLAANLLAWPLAYLVLSRWREQFAYQAPEQAGDYLLAGLLALAVTLATSGFQSWQAARSDPAPVLRQE